MFGCYGLFAIGGTCLMLAVRGVMRRESGERLIFSPFVLICLNEVVFVWPATIYARVMGISRDNYASLVVLSSTFSFVLGYALFQSLRGWPSRMNAQYHQRKLQLSDDRAQAVAIGATALFLILLGFYLYQGMPPVVSGFRQLLRSGYESGVAESLAADRLNLTKGHHFGGTYRGQGVIRFVMRSGWPYLAAISILLYLHRRERLWWRTSIALVAACFIYVGGDGTRGPVLWAFVSILVALSYHARIRLRSCVMFVSVILAVLLALSLMQKLSSIVSDGTFWSAGVQQISERIFVGNGINSIYVMEYVRDGSMDMRWGGIHATDIADTLPVVKSDQIPFAYELFLIQNPNAKVTRTTLASMTYLGRLYGDFGWIGCLGGLFLIGMLCAWASHWLLHRPKTISGTAFIGLTVFNISQLNLNGIVYFFAAQFVLVIVAKLHAFWLTLAAGRQRTRPISRPAVESSSVYRACR